MTIRARPVVVLIVLAGAALATWYYSRPAAVEELTRSRSTEIPPGYYLKDAVLLRTDDNGNFLYRIVARQVEQVADEEWLELSEVRVEYSREEDVQWLVSAEHAVARNDRSYLELHGNVHLESQPRDGAKRTVIETDQLRFEPMQFIASTSESVTVALGDTQLNASGLKAYLKDDKLDLSDVHAQFSP